VKYYGAGPPRGRDGGVDVNLAALSCPEECLLPRTFSRCRQLPRPCPSRSRRVLTTPRPGWKCLSVCPTRPLRLQRANREDVIRVPARLENLVPPDHPARRVWRMVEGLDLTEFYADIQVEESTPGAPATDP